MMIEDELSKLSEIVLQLRQWKPGGRLDRRSTALQNRQEQQQQNTPEQNGRPVSRA
jgi:hypothetical protein